MALALIRYKGTDGGEAVLEADIGTSRYYRYVIGAEPGRANGLETVAGVSHASALIDNGPFNGFRSQFELRIPARLFSREQRFVQLRSYRDGQGGGAAFSRVVEVYPAVADLPEDLPVMELSLNPNTHFMHPTAARSVPFTFREADLSTPMFWEALLDVARAIAPQVVSGISGAVTNGHPDSRANEEIVRIINSVIGLLGRPSAPGAAPRPAAPVPAAAAPAPAATAPATAPAPAAAPAVAQSLQRQSFTRQQSYSNQMIAPLAALAPLLLQNLPAIAGALGPLMQNLPQVLGPLLQQAPQLVQTAADSPIRLLNALAEFSTRNRQLNIQNKQADHQHIEHILADINRNLMLQQLLRSQPGAPLPELPPAPAEGTAPPATPAAPVSAAASLGAFGTVRKKVAPTVAVAFQKGVPVTVNGKPKYVYRTGGPLRLLVQVRTSGPALPKVIASLTVKNSVTRELYLEKQFRLKDVASNSIQELELLPSEVQPLPRQRDLIVTVSLRYLSGNTALDGGTDVHLILLTDEYFLQRFGDPVGEEISLGDRNKYRTFWNKIWEGGTRTKKRWQLEVDAKYYL
ncbi:MAG TPA: hypothetical protein VHK69_00130, partial [Chitinophagaceae bacterium]|nr:hypothetical protein [Chitinophagaceae bacterium]